jgi:hypothetical protein
MKKTSILMVMILMVSLLTNATNYYFSTGGADGNSGKKDSPYKSISKANTLALNPGDSLLFRGGDTFTGSLQVFADGSSTADIVVSSYDNIVNGETNNATISCSNAIAVNVFGAYITIRDLKLVGNWSQYTKTGSQTAYGIQLSPNNPGSGSVAVIGCDISSFFTGISGYYQSPATATPMWGTINIMYNTIHDCGKAGVDISGVAPSSASNYYTYGNLIFYKNYVYNNLGTLCSSGSGCGHSGDGAVFGSFHKGYLSNNVIFHGGWLCTNAGAGPAGIWCWDADSMIIEYNEAYDNGTTAGNGDGDGFDLDAAVTNSIMQYNYSHDNWAAGFLVWDLPAMRCHTNNNIVRYNISENDNIGYPIDSYNRTTFAGITIAAGSFNNYVYNNTVSSKNGPCLKVGSAVGAGNLFLNNIFYSTAPAFGGTVPPILYLDNDGNLLTNNIYYSPSGFNVQLKGAKVTSLANFKATTDGSGKYNEATGNGAFVDPKLTNPIANYTKADFTANTTVTNYQLLSGSPAKDKGLDLTASPYNFNVGKIDYNGLSTPSGTGYDIGACEAR